MTCLQNDELLNINILLYIELLSISFHYQLKMLLTVVLAIGAQAPQANLIECTICKSIMQSADDWIFDDVQEVEDFLD